MYALLFTAVLAANDPQAQQQNQPAQPQNQPQQIQRDQPRGDPPMSIEGNWTVLCLEKNGQPMPDAHKVTVNIKGNVATFNCPAGTEEKNKVRSMRIDFAPGGRIRVTEANADGKFSSVGTAPGAVPPGAAPGAPLAEQKTGVYVLAKDYFAVCVHDEGARPGVVPAGAVGEAGKPSSKSLCTVILKRSDSGRPNP